MTIAFLFWTGEIHLSIFISQNNASEELNDIGDQLLPPRKCPDAITTSLSMSSTGFSSSSSPVREETTSCSSKEEKSCTQQKSFTDRILKFLIKVLMCLQCHSAEVLT